MNHTVNHGDYVLANGDNQSAPWQFSIPQMHLATGTDLHRRRPGPAERFQDPSNRVAVNARPGRSPAWLPLCDPLA